MIEKVQYVNHMGETIDFGTNGIYINENDLHDFAWTIASKNDRRSSFKKGIVKRTLPVILACATDSSGIEARNDLFEICEKDVLSEKYGKLIIGNYYLKCYITESKSSKYTYTNRYAKITLTVQTDLPKWVKESTTRFGIEKSNAGRNLDYENDFPYDYVSNILSKKLINADFTDSNFRILVYGACENPSVTINGHLYSVNVAINSGEYLLIDSVEKTILLYRTDGSTENCFKYRNRDSYVFEKIPPGELSVLTSSSFSFDVTVLEERSVPKWI